MKSQKMKESLYKKADTEVVSLFRFTLSEIYDPGFMAECLDGFWRYWAGLQMSEETIYG